MSIADTPTFVDEGKRKYAIPGMVDILEPYRGQHMDTTVVLENVHSMPKQGVASSFNFGEGKGLWRGILAAMYLYPTLVSPQRWKKHFELDRNKKAAINKALELFPMAASYFTLAKHDGRAEALLMAEYLRRLTEGSL